MLEQEMASIIKFVLDHAKAPAPYYWNVPRNFTVPAAYFPPPEIDTGPDTFLTSSMDFAWYIKLFHKTAQGAYVLGHAVAAAIRAERNLVPLITENGEIVPESWVRVDDPSMKVVDDGAAQLTIHWKSRRPYNDTLADVTQVQSFNLDLFMKSGKTISDAYAETLERYAIPLNVTE